jgi:hypothetical protein
MRAATPWTQPRHRRLPHALSLRADGGNVGDGVVGYGMNTYFCISELIAFIQLLTPTTLSIPRCLLLVWDSNLLTLTLPTLVEPPPPVLLSPRILPKRFNIPVVSFCIPIVSLLVVSGFLFSRLLSTVIKLISIEWNRHAFPAEVLLHVCRVLLQEEQISKLAMRTLILSVTTYPTLQQDAAHLLYGLVERQVWAMQDDGGALWKGFVKCAALIQPASFPVLLDARKFPFAQFQSVLQDEPTLKRVVLHGSPQHRPPCLQYPLATGSVSRLLGCALQQEALVRQGRGTIHRAMTRSCVAYFSTQVSAS